MSEITNYINGFVGRNFLLGKNEETKIAAFMFKGVTSQKEIYHLIVVTPNDSSEVIACYVAEGGLTYRELFKYVSKVLRTYGIWDKEAQAALSTVNYNKYLFEHKAYVDLELTETFDVDRSPAMHLEVLVQGTDPKGNALTSRIEVRKIKKC